jgi:hypothetical protein
MGLINYCYRMAQAYVCQVALDEIMGGPAIPPSIYDLAPSNLYYALATICTQTDDQDWW